MILEARGLEKSYRGVPVAKDIMLHLNAGEVVGLLGPNGAGKTTVFHMIIGLVRPDQGEVYLDGDPITTLPMYLRARKGLGYLPQEPSIFRKLTVEENLTAVMEVQGVPFPERAHRVTTAMAQWGLGHIAMARASTLSGGERRRVELARALIVAPKVLLLDEPFAGLDPLTVVDLQERIAQLKAMGIGILITDHNVQETLEITDRAYILHHGVVIVVGTPQEIMRSELARSVYLGERLTVGQVGGKG